MKLFTQHHLRSFKSRCFNRLSGAGFTLVELLIVIAILGILAAGIVVVINPMEKINSANLAKAKTFAAGVENSLVMSQVGKWSFEEGTGDKAKDTSGNGNIGTLNGAVWQNPAQCGLDLGGCMKFAGGNDYVGITNIPAASVKTIEMWVNQSQQVGEQYLLNSIYQVNSNKYFYIGGTSDYFNWVPSINTWYHLVFTFPNGMGNTDEATLTYNGSNVVNVSPQGADRVGFDTSKIGGLYSPYGWKGLIDEVKIYNKALLSYQIQQLYARGLAKHLLALK